jgi:hypothetical protein
MSSPYTLAFNVLYFKKSNIWVALGHLKIIGSVVFEAKRGGTCGTMA